MFKYAALIAIAVSTMTLARAEAATGAEGDWRTPDDGAIVEVSACGEALCGRLVTSERIKANPGLTDLRNQDVGQRSRLLKGLTLFSGVKGGPPVWSGGSVYNPDDGKTYHGSINLVDANTLKLTGCVFGPFCKSETWTKVK